MRWPENLKLSGKLMLPVILGAIGILGISMALMLFIQGRNTRSGERDSEQRNLSAIKLQHSGRFTQPK